MERIAHRACNYRATFECSFFDMSATIHKTLAHSYSTGGYRDRWHYIDCIRVKMLFILHHFFHESIQVFRSILFKMAQTISNVRSNNTHFLSLNEISSVASIIIIIIRSTVKPRADIFQLIQKVYFLAVDASKWAQLMCVYTK